MISNVLISADAALEAAREIANVAYRDARATYDAARAAKHAARDARDALEALEAALKT